MCFPHCWNNYSTEFSQKVLKYISLFFRFSITLPFESSWLEVAAAGLTTVQKQILVRWWLEITQNSSRCQQHKSTFLASQQTDFVWHFILVPCLHLSILARNNRMRPPCLTSFASAHSFNRKHRQFSPHAIYCGAPPHPLGCNVVYGHKQNGPLEGDSVFSPLLEI